MSRRKLQVPDALELLLDTICNTFGAVIFLSMLLSIMVEQQSMSQVTEDAPHIVDNLIAAQQRDVARAKARQRQLSARMMQQETLLNKFGSPESINLATEIDQATRATAAALESQTNQIETLTDQEADSLRKQALMVQTTARRDRIKAEVDSLKEQLSASVASAGRQATVSRIRPTQKDGHAYMLHEGRLHRTTGPAGAFNSDDCLQVDRHGRICLIPKQDGGLKFPADKNAIQSKFRDLAPNSDFVRLFVSANSFAEFIPVKDALVAQGLEYEVLIFENNVAELFLSNEPIESFVQ